MPARGIARTPPALTLASALALAVLAACGQLGSREDAALRDDANGTGGDTAVGNGGAGGTMTTGSGQGGTVVGSGGGSRTGGGSGTASSGGATRATSSGGIGGGASTTDRSSLEFGRTLYGSDYATRASVPAGGTLFSVWTRIPDPGASYPWSHGNLDVYVLYGNNWYFRCLVGNSTANSATDARYNANSMLFANPGDLWVGDYSYYESGFGHPDAPYRDWVWVAWLVIVNPSSFEIHQWLKFGVRGDIVAAGDSSPAFAEVRAILVENGWTQAAASAWTPGDAQSFQVGKDNGYLTHARMLARGSLPSLAELDAIARSDAADPSAWADYRLAWGGNAPDLSDRSGNGRHLTLAQGGTLYAGPPGPAF
jgi:hypothetical protein